MKLAKFGPLALRAGAAVAVLLCLAAAWSQAQSARELTSIAQEVSRIRADLDGARGTATAPASNDGTDFALQLPASAGADAVVRDLQRASAAASVAFVSFAAVDRAPTTQTLGRLELRVTLRGSYAGTKSVVAEVMARQPAGVVQRLAMRQGLNASELDTQVDLLLLTRPLPLPSGGT